MTYAVVRKFVVFVSRDIVAESFADAETKAPTEFSKYLKVTPGTDLCDYENAGVEWITKGE
jgi:hypothetical protein